MASACAFASDVVFDYTTTRTIIVDARYMLWYMDAIDQADNVLTELGVTPSMWPSTSDSSEPPFVSRLMSSENAQIIFVP